MQAMQPQLHLHITAAVEWITPEAARKALGNKAANRHISRAGPGVRPRHQGR
jgi:hypothetical protein